MDLTFDRNSSTDAKIETALLQPDGKILIAGGFRVAERRLRYGVARLQGDGTADPSFELRGVPIGSWNWPWINGLALEADGKVLIGGQIAYWGQCVLRLGTNGVYEQTLATVTGPAGMYVAIYALAVQADGKVLVAGAFTNVNGLVRNSIARLETNGAVDTTFSAQVIDGQPLFAKLCALAVQADGRILLGGSFKSVNGVTRTNLARLHADGSVDNTFQADLPGSYGVETILIEPGGRIIVGGDFSSLNGVTRRAIARLESDGSLDSSFVPNAAGAYPIVECLALQEDGKVLVGGDFDGFDGVNRKRIARLNSDGTLDPTFGTASGGADSSVLRLLLLPGGKVFASGMFTSMNEQVSSSMARLHSDGSTDSTFAAGSSGVGEGGMVFSVGLQSDGKAIIGGLFTNVQGRVQRHIARLNPDGSLDPAFAGGNAGASTNVQCVAVQPDDKILAGGRFTAINGASRGRIARLRADGSVDSAFTVSVSSGSYYLGPQVSAIGLQPDGGIVVGGWFWTVNGSFHTNIARLNSNGTEDATFAASASSGVECLAIQPDGAILIGGLFSEVNGSARQCLARLNPDGTLDAGFNPPTLESSTGLGIYSILVQPDHKIVIGGEFTKVNGVAQYRLARLEPSGALDTGFVSTAGTWYSRVLSLARQQDGKLLIGGWYDGPSNPSRGPIRIFSNGAIDAGFTATLRETLGTYGYYYAGIYSMVIQGDGRVVAGGYFRWANEIVCNSIARFYTDRPPLDVARREQEVTLSWPVGWTGFVAEATTAPGLPWTNLSSPATSNELSWSVTVPATNPASFFRLRK